MTDADILLTVEHVAKACDVHQRTVRLWITEGKLLAVRLPLKQKGLRIRASDFASFMQTWISGDFR